MTNDMPLLARSIHAFSQGSPKDQMFYLISLKFVLALDKRMYKRKPSSEFLALICSLEDLIDRFDISVTSTNKNLTTGQETAKELIVEVESRSYNQQIV